MSSVLVGMFESLAAAKTAQSRLLAAGFSATALSMTGGTTTMAPDTMPSSPVGEGEHFGEGAVAKFFSNLFGGDHDTVEAQRDTYKDTYSEAFRRGSYGISVTAATDTEADKAETILNDCGAVDIDEKSAAWREEGWQGGAIGSAPTLASGDHQKLQEVEEELKVGKRVVAKGGVRIFSRMTEIPVSETVRLREEHANVQRKAVDRPATEADFAAFKEGSIEVREMAEEAVVGKTARVTGEVEIGKTATEREETIRDTVRKTTVDVEQIEGSKSPSMAGASSSQSGGIASSAVSANRDPITGAPGAHPVGTGIGAATGGVAAGAAAGSVAGPVGTAVGAAVGAVAGGLAGKGVAEKADPTVVDGKKTL